MLAGAALLLLAGCSGPDLRDLQAYVEATRQASAGKEFEPLPEIEIYKPFFYTAEGIRDPFALARFVVDALKREERPIVDNGIRPDDDRPREELEKYSLGSLKMVGSFEDPSGIGLWALVQAPDGMVHRVREGNYVGQNYGQIFSITEQRIDVQEIVPDAETGGWRERSSFLSLTE